ncbi:MAG: UDP-2,3-diacylglucosamine diphosphatase [Bdellovibrionia bacterium]
MSIIAVSDLHIWGPEDPLYSSLLTLLNERVSAEDTVVLAGDLFDLFVGNKSVFVEQYSTFIDVVKNVGNRGTIVHYIEGNHDFLIKKTFHGAKGIYIHSDNVNIEIEGKKFYFAHGDLVDQTDYAYRLLRLFFRSPIMKALVSIIPGKWLEDFGKLSSRKSRQRHSVLPHNRIEPLRKIFRNYAAEQIAHGYDFVVMGHCHDLDEMTFMVGNRKGQYVNMGFPRVHGSFLSWAPGEEKIQRERLP